MPYECLAEHQNRALSAALLLESRTAILYRCESVLLVNTRRHRIVSSRTLFYSHMFHVAQHRKPPTYESNAFNPQKKMHSRNIAKMWPKNITILASPLFGSGCAIETSFLRRCGHVQRVLVVNSVPA